MKKLCEIYDVSRDYDLKDNSVLVLISDLEKSALFNIIPELDNYFQKVMSNEEWQQFLSVDKNYLRNESKHDMRKKRRSPQIAKEMSLLYENDSISEILDNYELRCKIEKALSTLNETAKSRFLKHYYDRLTYRQIAEEENKSVSTIYESVMHARKKFLKFF